MIGAIVATILPIGFLILLFGGGIHLLRQHIEQDGDASINRTLFYLSKYSILVIWGAMVLQVWGIGMPLYEIPSSFQTLGMLLWGFGFVVLYLGRFELGSSFRLGTPREPTPLRVGGLFRLSRNPMYLGVYATVVASVLSTLNPVVIVLGAFVIGIHHDIVLAEERYLESVYGPLYSEYRNRVRRYI